jgi:hypothetical protein
LGRQLLLHADQARGRLRTLILTALKNFTVDQHRRAGARADPGVVTLSDLDAEETIFAPPPNADPDAAFDRRWALAQLHEALARGEAHFRASNKARSWEAFAARIVAPAIGTCPPVPLARVAQELGFANSADAAAAVQTVKKRVLAILRELAAEVTENAADAEAEYERVVALLA